MALVASVARSSLATISCLTLLGAALSCAPGEQKGGVEPEPTLSQLSVTPALVTLEYGAAQHFAVAGTMSDGSPVTPSVQWVATGGVVTSGGDYTAGSSAGTYRVIAQATGGAVADTSTVTVTAPPPSLTSIVVTPPSLSLQVGATQQFAVLGHLSDGSTSPVAVTFSATGGTVSPGGLYTAGASAGTFRLIATLVGGILADSSTITVTDIAPPPVLTAVILTPATVTLPTGTTQQFAATGQLSNGSSTSVTVGYIVTGGTITSGGLYTAGGATGSFKVIAIQQDGTLADTSTVTITAVPPTLTSLSLTPATVTLTTGATQQFTVSALWSNGTTTVPTVAYTVAGGVITAGGLYTAGGTAGTFLVIVSALGKADTSAITITLPTLTSLSLTPATVTLAAGATQQFAVAGTWSNGTTTPPPVTYTATGGTVSAGGLYTASSTAGTFRVIALHSLSGLADTSAITITAAPPTLTSLSMTPATVTLAAGATQQFTLTATWSNGTTTVPAVTFTSTGGTVSGTGLYTAGSTAGSFRVIVAHTLGILKDTSTVTITGGTGGTTLVTEGFESATLPGGANGWFDQQNITITTDARPGSSGTKALQWHWSTGATTPQSSSRISFTPSNAVYLSYWIKQSSNWTGSGHDYHPHMFHFLTTADDPAIGPSITHLTLYDELIYDPAKGGSVPYLALQDALMIDDTKLFVDLTNANEQRSIGGYNSKNGSCGGPEINVLWDCFDYGGGLYTNYKIFRPTTTVMLDANKNQWHHVESYWQMNSISGGKGQQDGVVQYWFDGALLLDRHDVYFRTAINSTMKFETFVMAPYIGDGSPRDQFLWIDDLTIGTAKP